MQNQIKQNTVLITGTSIGIGLATAKRFSEEGYHVIAVARDIKNRPNLTQLKTEFPNIQVVEIDLTDKADNIRSKIQSLPPIDILINNVGIGLMGAAESFVEDQIWQVLQSNIMGVVNVTNAIIPSMRQRKTGTIITISSLVGPMPDLTQWPYSASKAALEHYTAALKKDFEKNNYPIKIANIHPGPVLTRFESSAQEGIAFQGQDNPYPKMVDEIAFLRNLLKNGQPISETVETIMRVIKMKNPPFWNPTHEKVAQNFARMFHDPSGREFSQGPCDVSSSAAMKLGEDGIWHKVTNRNAVWMILVVTELTALSFGILSIASIIAGLATWISIILVAAGGFSATAGPLCTAGFFSANSQKPHEELSPNLVP